MMTKIEWRTNKRYFNQTMYTKLDNFQLKNTLISEMSSDSLNFDSCEMISSFPDNKGSDLCFEG